MTRPQPSPLAISIRQRLLNYAKLNRQDFQEVLRQYAQERLLFRLSRPEVQEAGFILKGALLFRLWDGAPHRATRDVDLLGHGEHSVARFEGLFQKLCQLAIEPPDGIEWDKDALSVEEKREDEEYPGLRVFLTGYLAEAKLKLQCDIGFGDAVTPGPVLITFPALLGLPPARLRAYNPETAIAEKTQIMVRQELRNSRVKDYWDIWTLSQHLSFQGPVLCQALAATFSRRRTPIPGEPPPGLLPAFAQDRMKRQQWQAFLVRSGVPPLDLGEVVGALNNFLWPPLQSLARNHSFDMIWPPTGLWQPSEQSAPSAQPE